MKMRLFFVLILFACVSSAQADQKGFFVRAVRSSSLERAESARNQLKQYGNVNIIQQGNRYIVWIGPIEDKEFALTIRNKIQNRHPNAVISETDPAQFVTTAAKVADSDEAPPNLDSLSPDAIRKEGMEHFEARRYEKALEKLSLFLSLYPAHNHFPSAMVTVAGIFFEMKRPLAAIRLYSHIIERYPGTTESIDSMIALADMSILSPGLKPSIALAGTRWYLDPVEAYDTVLSKNGLSPELTERLLIQRMAALRAQSRYREAYAEGGRFLDQNPGTKHKQTLLMALRSDVERLIEERFTAGDDIAVISLLSNARRRGLIGLNNTGLLIKASESYARIGMMNEARTLLGRARYFAAQGAAQVDAALQKLGQGQPSPDVSSPIIERWALYDKGRKYILSSNLPDAEKTLAQLKGSDRDEFWTKLADFALQDGARTSKYKYYPKK
jgi:tetratricopeptide (TPR) repeat protein